MSPLLLAALPSLFKMGAGAVQYFKGQDRLDDVPRPKYNTPPEIDAMLTLAEQEYGSVGRQELFRNIQADQSAANAAQVATNAGYGAQAAPRIEAQRQNDLRQSSVLADQKRMQDMTRLMAAQQTRADYRDQEYQINQFAPYSQNYNESREMIGGGMTNFDTGLSGISSLAQLYASGMNQQVPATEAAKVTTEQQNGTNVISNLINQYGGYAPLYGYGKTMMGMQNRPR